MRQVERYQEVLTPDCEKYLAENGMYSIADHKDEIDPVDIYTHDDALVVSQIPRDISPYYLMRLVTHGRTQYALGLAASMPASECFRRAHHRLEPSVIRGGIWSRWKAQWSNNPIHLFCCATLGGAFLSIAVMRGEFEGWTPIDWGMLLVGVVFAAIAAAVESNCWQALFSQADRVAG